MNASLLNIVKWIVKKYGESILDDPKKLNSVFASYVKNEPKLERIAFGRCIELGCYKEMKRARTDDDRVKIKSNLILKLHNRTKLDIRLCCGALDILEAALFSNVLQAQLSLPQKNNSQFKQRINIKHLIGISAGLVIVFSFILLVFNYSRKAPIIEQNEFVDNTSDSLIDDKVDGLQRIIEYQELIAVQIDQLRKQIEEEQKYINDGVQTAQQHKTKQEQLIEQLNNELLMEILSSKRKGMKDITGNILLVIKPINYKNRRFRINVDNLKPIVTNGINIITNDAMRYNQNLTFDVVYDTEGNGKYTSIKNINEAFNLYPQYVNKNYDFTALVFAVDTVERSYIWQNNYYAHAIMWFKEYNGHSAGTLAHEIYHAFGAQDFYYEKNVVPPEVERNFKALLGNSIMITSEGSSGLDPINAWLIGWNKSPEPWFAWFVDKRDTSELQLFNR